jgi:spoIIIJ-associated protein
MRIEAKTLEEAYYSAAKKLNCSVTDLEVSIIQYPSRGLFGFFSKTAIIEVKEEVERDIDEIIHDIEYSIKNLFKKSCFNIDKFEIKKYDDDTVFIKIDGEDAALLIGKEGYRYNALNFMLYSWINQKYGFKVRLEIAEFLKTQEEMLRSFLSSFIQRVKEKGYGKTKPFDGILAFIALEILREEFPEKYVAIKDRNGEKYVVIGEKHANNSGNSDA